MDIDIPQRYRDYLGKAFPNLREGVHFKYTSPVDYNYNCLSWALSCNTAVYENARGARWPWPKIPDDTPEGWVKVLQIHGFEMARNADFEIGYEKVAIYAELEDAEYNLHAARSDKSGTWKSKLGDMGPDIDHVSPECLESGYGKLLYFLRRRRKDWDEE